MVKVVEKVELSRPEYIEKEFARLLRMLDLTASQSEAIKPLFSEHMIARFAQLENENKNLSGDPDVQLGWIRQRAILRRNFDEKIREVLTPAQYAARRESWRKQNERFTADVNAGRIFPRFP